MQNPQLLYETKAEVVNFRFHNLQRNECADIIMETLYGINVFHSRKASNIQLLSSWVGTIFGPFLYLQSMHSNTTPQS